MFLPIGEAEVDAIRRRLTQELERVRGELARVDGRLASEDFLTRAPAEVVETERRRQDDLARRRDTLTRYLRALA